MKSKPRLLVAPAPALVVATPAPLPPAPLSEPVPILTPSVAPQPTAAPAPPPPTETVATIVASPQSTCPNGWAVHVNWWDKSSLTPDLWARAERLILFAEHRDSKQARDLKAYIADDVSGKLGGEFRSQIGTRAPLDGEVTANLRDPKTGAVLQSIGKYKIIGGEGDILLTEEQYGKIVEVIFPRNFKSPTVSGGSRRLWSRPEERPNTCSTNVHGITAH